MRRISIPQVFPHPQNARRKFGFDTHARQTCAIAGTAFGTIAKSAAGLVLLAVTMLVVLLYLHSWLSGEFRCSPEQRTS